MQFDLFHVYTVDQHTLAVLANIAGFHAPDPQRRFALAHEVWPRLRKPELLLLAGLFHDIAKGRGGDHSEARQSVVEGTSVSVRVDLGGRRIIKKPIKSALIQYTNVCSKHCHSKIF